MTAMSRRAFAGLTGLGAASLALGALGVPAALAEEASPADDFEFEEVDGLIAITGYVGQAEEVVVPRSINGTLVGLIWDGAFKDKSAIFKVTLPKGVAYIGEGAFAGCISLEEVVLPEGFAGPFFYDTYPEQARLVTPGGEEVLPERWLDGTTGLPVVEFGSYPQSGDEPKPIAWLVLEERADGTSFLLSRRCLSARPYHNKMENVTWKTCDLRAWLNGEFLEAAFSSDERAQIVEQHLENPDNPKHGTPGGSVTDDSVFLLGLQEVEQYFGAESGDTDRRLVAHPTLHAINEGVQTDDNDACFWWLRTPSFSPEYAAHVGIDGYVYSRDTFIDWTTNSVKAWYGGAVNKAYAVRPAIVVKTEVISHEVER